MGCTKKEGLVDVSVGGVYSFESSTLGVLVVVIFGYFFRLGGDGFLYKTIQRRILLWELVENYITPSIIEEWPIVTMMIHSCDNCYFI